MAISNIHIAKTVRDYMTDNLAEVSQLEPVAALLDAGVDITVRTEFRGHATTGATLVNPDGEVLHVHHVALGCDLLSGGHLEATDATLRDAALRELTQETRSVPKAVRCTI